MGKFFVQNANSRSASYAVCHSIFKKIAQKSKKKNSKNMLEKKTFDNVQVVEQKLKRMKDVMSCVARNVDMNFVGFVCKNTMQTIIRHLYDLEGVNNTEVWVDLED